MDELLQHRVHNIIKTCVLESTLDSFGHWSADRERDNDIVGVLLRAVKCLVRFRMQNDDEARLAYIADTAELPGFSWLKIEDKRSTAMVLFFYMGYITLSELVKVSVSRCTLKCGETPTKISDMGIAYLVSDILQEG